MSKEENVLAALDTAIQTMAEKAARAQTHGISLAYATAAGQLAEARAWVTNPNQPHGGVAPTP